MSKKPKNSVVLPIMLVVALSFLLLSLSSALNIQSFQWAFEVAVLVVAVAAVYYILRKNALYTYAVIGENLVFKQQMGKSERFVFAVHLSDIRGLVPSEEIEAQRVKLGSPAMAKYYRKATDLPLWGLVYYDGTYKCEKILTFAPSEQLLEVLSKKAIDNRG